MPRQQGTPNYKNYRWRLVHMKEGKIQEGKYSSIREMNEDTGYNWNTDFINRLWTQSYDTGGKLGKNSFVSRWGHIKLDKIKEKREKPPGETQPIVST
jgi:hypothetical protein